MRVLILGVLGKGEKERKGGKEKGKKIHHLIFCGAYLKKTTSKKAKNVRTRAMLYYPIQIPVPFVIFYHQKNQTPLSLSLLHI